MARFTKGNRRKKSIKRSNYNDRCINSINSMLIDKKLGYEVSKEVYQQENNKK